MSKDAICRAALFIVLAQLSVTECFAGPVTASLPTYRAWCVPTVAQAGGDAADTAWENARSGALLKLDGALRVARKRLSGTPYVDSLERRSNQDESEREFRFRVCYAVDSALPVPQGAGITSEDVRAAKIGALVCRRSDRDTCVQALQGEMAQLFPQRTASELAGASYFEIPLDADNVSGSDIAGKVVSYEARPIYADVNVSTSGHFEPPDPRQMRPLITTTPAQVSTSAPGESEYIAVVGLLR